MKKFVFRLERLSRLREAREREARAAAAESLAALSDARQRVLADREEARAAQGNWPARGSHDIADLRHVASVTGWWRSEIERAQAQFDAADLAAGESLELHRETLRDARVLRRLRERRRRRWNVERDREEQLFLDEMHRSRLPRDRDEVTE